MSNEKDNKKKTMYVPDEEVLAYNRAKKAEETTEEPVVTEEVTVEEVVAAVDSAAQTENNEEKKSQKKGNPVLNFLGKFFPKKGDNPKTIIIKAVAIVAAIAIIVSGTYLALYFGDLGQQNAKIENIRNNYDLNRDDYTKNEDNQFSKFDILKAQNSDIVGWITIPNTEVNNPVYQTTDNQYYVTHDMDKKNNSYGALFLDYRCKIDPKALTRNQIIYGHNMRYGAMFGTLKEYRKLDFYKKNPIIKFDSLYEQRTYKIFAMMIVNDSEDTTFGYSYTAYRTDFTSDNDFLDWVKHSRDRSLFDTPVDVTSEDEIIVLSTCCYDFDNARFVVLGRLVREGESEEVKTDSAAKNEDVLYPKAYYDKKGLKVPKLTSSEETTSKETTSKDKK